QEILLGIQWCLGFPLARLRPHSGAKGTPGLVPQSPSPSPGGKGCVGRMRNLPLLAVLPLRRHRGPFPSGCRTRGNGSVTERRMLPTAIPADGAGPGAPPPRARAGGYAWVAVALSVLALVALLLRLQAAWHRNHEAPDALVWSLVGDEMGYE